MAPARKTRPPAKPSRPPEVTPAASPAPDHWILRAFDATYRFLASVKLAVICIFTLAMVLAGATFFESGYGIPAVRQYVYQHPAFAILLAFLGTNIFCAATIRFPWKKRQVGFLVTHIGLLVILGGAFVSLRASDEGQLGMTEGTATNELVRIDHKVVRIQKVDPKTGAPGDTYKLPFDSGAFSWHADELTKLAKDGSYQARVWLARASLAVAAILLVAFLYVWVIVRPPGLGVIRGSLLVSLFIAILSGTGLLVALTPAGPRREVLTDATDPFTFVVTDYLASSGIKELRAESAPDGEPAAKVALLVTPPGQANSRDALDGRNWIPASRERFYRQELPSSPAAVVYQFVPKEDAEVLVDDFLHPPKSPNTDRVARIHYLDNKQARRVYEWALSDDSKGKSVALPDSDLAVTLEDFPDFKLDSRRDAPPLRLASFAVKRGKKDVGKVRTAASLPLASRQANAMPEGLLGISYFYPPDLTAAGGGMGGRLAQVEILQVEGGKVYVRAFGRRGLMGDPSQVVLGKPVPLVASVNMPMKIAVRVDEAKDKVRLRNVYLPMELPREQRDSAISAIQAEMTVKGVTRSISLLQPPRIFEEYARWEDVQFPDATYRVCYDFDRTPFPEFSLSLVKFEPGRDPGSDNAASYRSDVTLSDPAKGLKDVEHAIYMNNPLTHRDWTFFQSSFDRVTDPVTGKSNGAYASIFQVHYDPAWKIVYSGCLLTVIGIFLQFYMRAGLFSDGGKREREVAQAKLKKKLDKAAVAAGQPIPTPKPRPAKVDEVVEDL